jgi:hypothetical protein
MTDCRHAEWDEELLREEWRDRIAPEDWFTGWSSLDTVAKRVEASALSSVW